jgi:oxygen-independent coproporphyrinogen-3 oxidase
LTDLSSSPLGLYVHIPFCEAKCTYCHFAIDTLPGDARQDRYLRSLLAEIEGASPGLWADTIYFGGGTPSLFGVSRLATVINALSRQCRLSSSPEITSKPTRGILTSAATGSFAASASPA